MMDLGFFLLGDSDTGTRYNSGHFFHRSQKRNNGLPQTSIVSFLPGVDALSTPCMNPFGTLNSYYELLELAGCSSDMHICSVTDELAVEPASADPTCQTATWNCQDFHRRATLNGATFRQQQTCDTAHLKSLLKCLSLSERFHLSSERVRLTFGSCLVVRLHVSRWWSFWSSGLTLSCLKTYLTFDLWPLSHVYVQFAKVQQLKLKKTNK